MPRPFVCSGWLQLRAAVARFPKGCQETTEGLEQGFQAAAKGHEEICKGTAEGAQAGTEKKRPLATVKLSTDQSEHRPSSPLPRRFPFIPVPGRLAKTGKCSSPNSLDMKHIPFGQLNVNR